MKRVLDIWSLAAGTSWGVSLGYLRDSRGQEIRRWEWM